MNEWLTPNALVRWLEFETISIHSDLFALIHRVSLSVVHQYWLGITRQNSLNIMEIGQASVGITSIASIGNIENKWVASSRTRVNIISFDEEQSLLTVKEFPRRQKKCEGTEKKIYLLGDTLEVCDLELQVQETMNRKLDNFWVEAIDDAEYLTGVDQQKIYYGANLEETIALEKTRVAKLFMNTLIAANKNTLNLFDIRTKKQKAILKEPHIRTIDINQSIPTSFTTGDEQRVKLWDARKLDRPMMEIFHHSHWIESVRYNKFHDQLLLTSSTDSLVNLECIGSCSSNTTNSLQDGLLKCFEELDDSVYGAEWSLGDPWIFCAVSYAGRILVATVPQDIRYKILDICLDD